jgi:MFS family permease
MQAETDKEIPTGSRLAVVLVLFGWAYFLSLFFRSINAIVAPDLIRDLGLDAASLGLLTAAYFLGLCLMQVPLGVLLDRYGPRIAQGLLLLIAAAGAGIFALAQDLWLLTLARGLIGVGLAGALMAAFQVSALWLRSDQLPLANGCFLAVGGLGVLASTAPVEFALGLISWRHLFGIVAVLTAAIAFGIFLLTPQPRRPAKTSNITEQVLELRHVLSEPIFWRYAPLTAVCFATGTAMQGLWATAWLRDVVMSDRSSTALYLTGMAIALTIGSVGGGIISLFLQRFGLGVRHVVIGAALLFMLAQIGLLFGPLTLSAPILFLFALTYNVVTLSYAALAQHFPKDYVGRANTAMNAIVIGVTFAVQYGIGLAVGFWESDAASGLPPIAYKMPLGLLLLIQFASFIWLLSGNKRHEMSACRKPVL